MLSQNVVSFKNTETFVQNTGVGKKSHLHSWCNLLRLKCQVKTSQNQKPKWSISRRRQELLHSSGWQAPSRINGEKSNLKITLP